MLFRSIEHVAAENFAGYIAQGLEPEVAEQMANDLANKARATVKHAEPILKKKGY